MSGTKGFATAHHQLNELVEMYQNAFEKDRAYHHQLMNRGVQSLLDLPRDIEAINVRYGRDDQGPLTAQLPPLSREDSESQRLWLSHLQYWLDRCLEPKSLGPIEEMDWPQWQAALQDPAFYNQVSGITRWLSGSLSHRDCTIVDFFATDEMVQINLTLPGDLPISYWASQDLSEILLNGNTPWFIDDVHETRLAAPARHALTSKVSVNNYSISYRPVAVVEQQLLFDTVIDAAHLTDFSDLTDAQRELFLSLNTLCTHHPILLMEHLDTHNSLDVMGLAQRLAHTPASGPQLLANRIRGVARLGQWLTDLELAGAVGPFLFEAATQAVEVVLNQVVFSPAHAQSHVKELAQLVAEHPSMELPEQVNAILLRHRLEERLADTEGQVAAVATHAL